MSAYVVVDVDVYDEVRFAEYRKLGVPTIAAHGGRVLARSDDVVVLEAGGQTREDVSPFLEANIGAKVEVGQAGIPAGIGNLLALLGMNTQVGGAGTQATGEGGDHSRRES